MPGPFSQPSRLCKLLPPGERCFPCWHHCLWRAPLLWSLHALRSRHLGGKCCSCHVHTMPTWLLLLGIRARRQYWPVWLLRRMVVWPGWMGLVLLGLLGLMAVYCSGLVVPLPLPE